MTDVLNLVLPLPANRGNAREHWRTTLRKKKAYYAEADVALHNQLAGKLEGWPGRATLTATLYVWSKMDPDGRTARLKWAVDSLTRYGLLTDDSDEYLTWTEIPKQVVDRKRQRVEITLVPTHPEWEK